MTKITISTKHTAIHNVQACILGCQDPRFQDARAKYLQEAYGLANSDYDPLVAPGAGKWILDGKGEVLLFGVEVAVGLHAGETVYVFHHTDCGAYGGHKNFDSLEAEVSFQKDQLQEVKDKILAYLQQKGAATPTVVLILEHIGEGEVTYETV